MATLQNENVRESKEKGSLEYRVVSLIGNFMKNYKTYPEEDEELYGTSPQVIGILMILVTLFLPVGIINLVQGVQMIPGYIYSGFWLLGGEYNSYFVFRPEQLFPALWITIPLCGFNLLFIRQVNRFFQGKTSRDIALTLGIASMILPSVITVALWATYDFPFLITPIPIQFFTGLILLYKYREPEVISPWKGFYLDWSWWVRLRHSIHDPDPKVINLTNMLREHDAEWLEGYDD